MTLTGAGERQTPDRALLMQRLRARARANGMADVIRHRLRVFTETTSPFIDYYRNRGILVEVDGDQSPESVTSDI